MAEENIKTFWDKVPVFIRIGLLLDLAGFALEYSDQNKTLELVNEAQILLDDSQWRLFWGASDYIEGWQSSIIRGEHERKDGQWRTHETTFFT